MIDLRARDAARSWPEILRRDPCAYCGAREQVTVDHIEPKAKGGAKSVVRNGTAACYGCNQAKADNKLIGFLAARAGMTTPAEIVTAPNPRMDSAARSAWSISKHAQRVIARQPAIDSRWLKRMRKFMSRNAPLRMHVSGGPLWAGTWLFLHPASTSRVLFVSARCIASGSARKYRIEALGWVDDAWCEQRDLDIHDAVQVGGA